MTDEVNMKICSLELKDGEWIFYDYTGRNQLASPCKERIFTSAMKKRYKKNRNICREDISTVWMLKGVTLDEKEIWIQVGRAKDLINALDEIRENIKGFYFDTNKYAELKKNYIRLEFYEVNIDEYLKEDKLFKEMYVEVPKSNKFFELAYYFVRAAYVEGKLGYETCAYQHMYHTSTLDDYFFSYYKTQ